MDKKKVKEHIQRALVWIDPMTTESANYETAIEMAAKNLEFAMEELSKSDWVSVEDGLPPYGEVVLVVCETYPSNIWSSSRRDRFESGCTIDNHDFGTNPHFPIITHWKPIEKLEE